ncbi:hypothetical protein KY285_010835 [Solanum tuberosum]|nr:hypothetical protein KY289_011406 [Solanum tuberosum]KAH0735128.1 hypothetical protein KY285_010835 [Solanum tuberosum]
MRRHRTQNGELQLPIVAPPISWGVDNEDRNAYNAPKRAKSLKISGSLKHQRKNEVDRPMKVRVQSDLAGCLVITGQPNQLDNLWGVTAFKKRNCHAEILISGCENYIVVTFLVVDHNTLRSLRQSKGSPFVSWLT